MFVRYIGSAFWSHCDLQAAWRRVQSRLQASQQDHQAVRMQFTGCLCGTHHSVSGMRSLFADELDLQKKTKTMCVVKTSYEAPAFYHVRKRTRIKTKISHHFRLIPLLLVLPVVATCRTRQRSNQIFL